MSRPIEYDPQDVIMKTMTLFWEQGYENTSVRDVVNATGLKPGSLYNMYGNKEGIFNAVVKNYSKINKEQIEKILFKDDNALQNIETFLNEIVIASISNKKTDGCLLVKTLLVVPPKDQKVQESIKHTFDEVESMLEKVLSIAKERNETDVDAKLFSKFIVSTIYGAHVYYKTNKDVKILQDSVDLLIEMIKLKNSSLIKRTAASQSL